ncbi:hypothetical protein GCM10010211_03550 [Streptomyces albospinus]|uniref:Uncharacterized protein n=1 Tax=Streptomyces albospinus TaxID=285515 RepID=A0ABQ2UNW1_9ACTN|nr:hypothetical protein GCM10010211_03550 [Streptomyces albospinus]
MPQVVRPSGQDRRDLCRLERQLPGALPGSRVRRRRHDVPPLTVEQPPVLPRAELLHMLLEQPDQRRRDRHLPDLSLIPLLEAPAVVHLSRISPCFARGRTRFP